MSRKFVCAACGAEFTSEREEGAAREEFHANFPDEEFELDCVVCEPCYEEFWQWMKKAYPEIERKV